MRHDSSSTLLETNQTPEKADVSGSVPSAISVATRLRTHLRHKLILLLVLPVAIYVPYFLLQHWSLFPPTEMPTTALERAVPFQPGAVWPYNSIYFLVLLAPFSMMHRWELQRYTRSMLALGFLANLCFLLWPTTCKRPVLEQPHAAYEFLVAIDAPLHACPSLHAGFSVLSALCLGAAMGRSWNWLWSLVIWLWVGVIFYGTLATKQHVLTDLLAGSALAVLAFRLFWRASSREEALTASSGQA